MPVHALVEHCRRGETGLEIAAPELLDFLKRHEDVQVVDGPAEVEPVSGDMFRAAGIEMGPRAILKTRVPDAQELARMMREQLDGMAQVLEKALSQAAEKGDDDACARLRDALERTHTIRARMEQFLS